jgi:hypothetical protein
MSDTEKVLETPTQVISEAERLTLELAQMQRKLSASNAELALARTELSELQHKYLILQLYHKYGLSDKDAIGEQGQILRDYVKEIPNGTK